MIVLIIKSYLSVLLPILSGAVLLLVAGIWFIFEKRSHITQKAKTHKTAEIAMPANVAANDMRAIAGEDLISTQLDLARAFIEAGKKPLAKQLLEQVMAQGSQSQQQEARQLSGLC